VVHRGVRVLGFGGAKTPRPAVYEYSDKQMWKKVKRAGFDIRRNRGFDILVTHAPAQGLGDGPDIFHEGFEAFRYLDDVHKPKIHFYGHRHMSQSPVDRKAIYQYGDTTMINACGYKLVEYDNEFKASN